MEEASFHSYPPVHGDGTLFTQGTSHPKPEERQGGVEKNPVGIQTNPYERKQPSYFCAYINCVERLGDVRLSFF